MSNEKFQQWWAAFTHGLAPHDAMASLITKAGARAAWNARLSDEDAETCIAALQVASQDARSCMANGKRSDRVWAIGAAKRYERTRRRLEGK